MSEITSIRLVANELSAKWQEAGSDSAQVKARIAEAMHRRTVEIERFLRAEGVQSFQDTSCIKLGIRHSLKEMVEQGKATELARNCFRDFLLSLGYTTEQLRQMISEYEDQRANKNA